MKIQIKSLIVLLFLFLIPMSKAAGYTSLADTREDVRQTTSTEYWDANMAIVNAEYIDLYTISYSYNETSGQLYFSITVMDLSAISGKEVYYKVVFNLSNVIQTILFTHSASNVWTGSLTGTGISSPLTFTPSITQGTYGIITMDINSTFGFLATTPTIVSYTAVGSGYYCDFYPNTDFQREITVPAEEDAASNIFIDYWYIWVIVIAAIPVTFILVRSCRFSWNANKSRCAIK